MKKISTLIAAGLLTMLSATAFAACPAGTALAGGSGPDHKGGKCVTTTPMTKQEKMTQHNKMVKQDAMKTDHMAAKSTKHAEAAKTHAAKAKTEATKAKTDATKAKTDTAKAKADASNTMKNP